MVELISAVIASILSIIALVVSYHSLRLARRALRAEHVPSIKFRVYSTRCDKSTCKEGRDHHVWFRAGNRSVNLPAHDVRAALTLILADEREIKRWFWETMKPQEKPESEQIEAWLEDSLVKLAPEMFEKSKTKPRGLKLIPGFDTPCFRLEGDFEWHAPSVEFGAITDQRRWNVTLKTGKDGLVESWKIKRVKQVK